MSFSIAQLTLPMFIGTIINWLLFGVLLVQAFIYFWAFPKDQTRWKIGVAAVVFLEFIETLSNARDMSRTFGTGWGNFDILDDVGWAWFSVPFMGAIIASVGQAFFAYRIYVIAQSVYIPSVILVLSSIQLAAGIWTGVVICVARKFSLLPSRSDVPGVLWLAGTSLCDLVIVFAMVYYLNKSCEPGFKKVASAVRRIIMLTVETGSICAFAAILDLILSVTTKDTNNHLAICFGLSKLYSNSILLIFNSRVHMGHEAQQPGNVSLNLPNSVLRGGPTMTTTIEFAGRVSQSSDEGTEVGLKRANLVPPLVLPPVNV